MIKSIKKLQKKKSKKLVVRKILWDDTYGDQPIFRPLGGTGDEDE